MAASPNTITLLESVSPATRKLLVSERIGAMRGDLAASLVNLNAAVATAPAEAAADRVGLGFLIAELLHLDRREAEAVDVLKRVVAPVAAGLPVEYQFAYEDNLSSAQMSSLSADGATTFYRLVDRWRAAGFDWSRPDESLEAQMAMERERYHEAVAAVWRTLLRAYRLGSWRQTRFAQERYAKLCVRIGALEEACHYAVVSELDPKELAPLVAALTARRDGALISAVVGRLLASANLRPHFTTACGLLAAIADLVPDEDVPRIGEWILPRCADQRDEYGGSGSLPAAWKVVRELGPRFPADLSERLIGVAVSHPVWLAPSPVENRVIPFRDDIADAVTTLAYSAPASRLAPLAEETIPLATDRVDHPSYPKVVNLLCHIASRGGDELTRRIASALYPPPGQPISRILAQLATFFGVEALTSDQWEAFAGRVIEETKLMVQRVKTGETTRPVPEMLMTMTQTTAYGQLVVTIINGAGLGALAEEQAKLSDESVARIIRTLMEMATDRDNLPTNRELLLARLCDFADRVDQGLRDEVTAAIGPLARGDVPESQEYPTAAALGHPLSRGRFTGGSPADVRTMAMVALAAYSVGDDRRKKEAGEVLSEALVDPDAGVRCGAYAAARRLPGLPADGILAVLMGLRDLDPRACISAFAAVTERTEWALTRPMWRLFLLAVRLASQSHDVTLRRHAVQALKARVARVPQGALHREAGSLLTLFASDAAYSVRAA